MDSPKYPRTFHMPWSKGATNDDKIATSLDRLIDVPIILSEKCDGGNASLEVNGCYARTHAAIPTHKSFDWLKGFHSSIKHLIPNDIQIFGENMYALHSIVYDELPGYFLIFNVAKVSYNRSHTIVNEPQRAWMSWDTVEKWAEKIGTPTVPVLFKGQVSSEKELKDLVEDFMSQPSCCGGIREGVVARTAEGFLELEFPYCMLKCVRANHVSPDNDHWKYQEIVKNKLKLPIIGS